MAVVWAGFVASILSACVFWLFRTFEVTRFSPGTQLGCLFFREPNVPLTETVGFLLFLTLGASVVPALYAVLLEFFGGPGWGGGLLVGAVHGAAVVGALPLLQRASRCIREGRMPAPGRFGLQWGRATPLAILAGHAAYGSVVGGVLDAF
jgi:hypothetical protein